MCVLCGTAASTTTNIRKLTPKQRDGDNRERYKIKRRRLYTIVICEMRPLNHVRVIIARGQIEYVYELKKVATRMKFISNENRF